MAEIYPQLEVSIPVPKIVNSSFTENCDSPYSIQENNQ